MAQSLNITRQDVMGGSSKCFTHFVEKAQYCSSNLQLHVSVHGRDTYQLGKMNWQGRCFLRTMVEFISAKSSTDFPDIRN